MKLQQEAVNLVNENFKREDGFSESETAVEMTEKVGLKEGVEN